VKVKPKAPENVTIKICCSQPPIFRIDELTLMEKLNKKTTIVLENIGEQNMLKEILCIASELGNDAVRKQGLSEVLVRCGLDSSYQAGLMRDFANKMLAELTNE